MTRIMLLGALLCFVSCGPVPWDPCSASGTKRCAGAEVQLCDGDHWSPVMDCESSITGADGNPIVEQCVEEGKEAACKPK